MSKFGDLMEWIGISIGCISAGTITTTGVYTGIEYGTSECIGKSTSGLSDFSTEAGNGNSRLATTVIGTIGGMMATMGSSIEGIEDSSHEPDTVVKFKDNNGYARIEAKAQILYDNLNKNHNENYKMPIILADTPEKAKSLKNILNSFGTKEELYIYLTALQMTLEKNEREHHNSYIKKLKK